MSGREKLKESQKAKRRIVWDSPDGETSRKQESDNKSKSYRRETKPYDRQYHGHKAKQNVHHGTNVNMDYRKTKNPTLPYWKRFIEENPDALVGNIRPTGQNNPRLSTYFHIEMFQQNSAKKINQAYGFLMPTKKFKIKKMKEKQILEKWEQERKSLDCGPSQSSNPDECGPKIDLDSMLMMQPPPEKKIKMEIEEPLEKVIKIENDINERVKIEIEEEKAVLYQNFGSTTIFPKTTVISDGELKEIKPEPIYEDKFEVKPPPLEPEIDLSETPKIESTKGELPNAKFFPKHKLYKRRCSVCLGLEDYSLVEYVTTRIDKMIILLGMILGGRLCIPEAKCQYKTGTYACVCRRHFHESLCYLLASLGVKNAENICNANPESIREILEIVKFLQGTPMTADQFELAVIIFVENAKLKDDDEIEVKPPLLNPEIMPKEEPKIVPTYCPARLKEALLIVDKKEESASS